MTSIAKSRSQKKRIVQDAIQLLTSDHAEVAALFKKYDKLTDANAQASDRQAHAEQICTLLTVHATIEEEIFYPTARAAGIDASLMDEADVEHAAAKDLIAQIRAMSPEEDHYDAKVKVLGEYIKHHVKEEEQPGGIFAQAKKGDEDLDAMGERLKARKEELMAKMGGGKN